MKKLAIIGSTPGKENAPYSDMGYDIWAISGAAYSESLGKNKIPNTDDNTWNTVHRLDMLFEMHKRPVFKSKLEKLSTCAIPVMMQRHERDIPTSLAYPADDVSIALGGEDYSSTIAYMLALALYRGYKHIDLYGIIMLHKTEYTVQRPGVKYYIGMATAMGVIVNAPEETALTIPKWRYGYDDIDTICGQISEKKVTIDDDIKNQTKAIDAAQATLWQLKGASITCENLIAEIKGGLS